MREFTNKSEHIRIRYLNAGDSAVIMEFGNEILPEINFEIRRITDILKYMERGKREFSRGSDGFAEAFAADAIYGFIEGIIEVIPTYRSIAVIYDPLMTTRAEVVAGLERIRNAPSDVGVLQSKIVEVPVCYGGVFGEDLSDVAAHVGLSEDEVVSLHTGEDYLVYMLGFVPGFAYLGGMDKRLATPRLATPRLRVEAGSVGIAGNQTGVYPLTSPGGWRLIGRTPLKLYDPRIDPPVFINAGDYIRFCAIDEGDFKQISRLVEQNKYAPNIYFCGI